MKVAIVFGPDPGLGADPLDEHASPRRIGEFIDSDKSDVLVMWREYGVQFTGGFRTHVAASGVWENVTTGQLKDALARIGDLE